MGNIHKIGNQIIRIHDIDHEPPHVHILGGGVNVKVYLDDLRTKGDTSEARNALEWIKENREMLINKWTTLHRQEKENDRRHI